MGNIESKRHRELTRGPAIKRKNPVPEVFQNDPHAVIKYENALKHGKETDKTVRVNVVGNFNQGKTSLVRRLLKKSTDNIQSTNGIDIETFKCKPTNNGEFLNADFAYDDPLYEHAKRLIAAAESIKLTTKRSDRNVSALKTDKQIEETISTDNLHDPSGSPNEDMLVSQRRATEYNQEAAKCVPISSNSQKAFLTPNHQLSKLLVKVKQTINKPRESDIHTRFSVWDFGGQFLFYATHSLFHSRKAIYLLVFDLSTQLSSVINDTDCPVPDDERTMQYYFEFWMTSIHSLVGTEDGSEPIVLLVGTHRDKVPGDENTKKKSIDKYFEDIRALFDGTSLSRHIFPEDFAVDNTVSNDVSIANLRRSIIEIGNQTSETIELPAKWILLEMWMCQSKHLKVITFSHLLDLDSKNEFLINDVDELKLFLRYHHTKGTFIYFDVPQLSEYVFVDPQFVVDAFKSVVTCQRFTKNDPTVRPLWLKLLSEAKLDERLIDVQWSQDQNFIKHKKILLMALKEHNILSKVTKYDEEANKTSPISWYIVPSFLRYSYPVEKKEDFFKGRPRTIIRFVMKFSNSTIVPLVFHRLLSASVGRWSIVEDINQPMIFQNLCVVRVDRNHAGVLELNINCIELWLVSLSPAAINCDQADRFRRFAESVVKYEFNKLQQSDGQNIKPYLVCYKCNDESHGASGSKQIEEMKHLAGSKYIICPDLKSHNSCIVAAAAKSQWFTEISLTKQENTVLLNEKVISKVSQHIGNDWEQLGLQLEFSRAQINQIIKDYPNSAMQRFRMLKEWIIKLGSDATMGKLVDAMKMCSSVDIDWNEIRNLIEENKGEAHNTVFDGQRFLDCSENKRISGQPFRKSFDNTLSESMMEILTGQMKSVGVLMFGDDMVGTVFRVGKTCIMTALHVITFIIGDNGSRDTTKLEDTQTYVHFYKSGIIAQSPVDIFYLRKEFICNSELDVAVLQIRNPENLPCKMRLSCTEVNLSDVSLIGYGNPNNAHKKVLDPRCEIVFHQSERMLSVLSWLKQNKSMLRSKLQSNADLIDIGYQGYDNPAVLLFDCYITHGASGAPILSNNNENSVTVVGVLTHGLPEFYFKLPDQAQKDVPDYCKLEMGAKMNYIYDWIAQSHSALVQDFFY